MVFGAGVLTAIGLLLPAGRHRQVGAAAAAGVAPRRHGRPHAGLGADPRRHHGHRRRLPDRPCTAPLFASSPGRLDGTVAWVGVLTALIAAFCGVRPDRYQEDPRLLDHQPARLHVRRGRRVGAYWVAIFHLFTHAFFKALLFLGAGSVIHALGGEQDIRRMGGLGKHLRVTGTTSR